MKKLLLGLLILLLAPPASASWYTFNGVDSHVHGTSASLALTVATRCVDTIRTGPGGNNLGRIYQQGSLFLLHASAHYAIDAVHSTSGGNWRAPKPDEGVRTHVCVAYNGSSTSNDPIVWYNGISQTVTETTAPVGTLSAVGNTLNWGNATASRSWDGQLGNACVWNRILTTNEVLSIMHYGCQSLVNGLISYLPMGVFGVIDLADPSISWTGSGTLIATDTGPVVSAPQGGFSWW